MSEMSIEKIERKIAERKVWIEEYKERLAKATGSNVGFWVRQIAREEAYVEEWEGKLIRMRDGKRDESCR